MQNNSSHTNTVLIVIVIILLAAGLWMIRGNMKNNIPDQTGTATTAGETTGDETPTPVVTGNASDLVAFSIVPGSTVQGKITATGSVKGAYFFEANIRVNILDANQNLLKAGNGTATSDWMTVDPVTFTTTLDFTGLTPGAGFIQIMNDNPSGDKANDKSIYIPVVIQ